MRYYGDLFSCAKATLFADVVVAFRPFVYGPFDVVGCVAVFEAPDVFGQLGLGLVSPVFK